MKSKTLKLCIMAMFAAISVVAIAFIRIPIIPAAPFLVYDMADIPILLTVLFLGGIPGIAVLAVVCLIQAFLMGGDGLIGFLMHFVSTSAMVIIFGTICKNAKTFVRLVIAALFSTLAMAVIMIPMNLLFTGLFLGNFQQVVNILVPAIIPFNLIKAGLNCVLSVAAYKLLMPVFKKTLKLK